LDLGAGNVKAGCIRETPKSNLQNPTSNNQKKSPFGDTFWSVEVWLLSSAWGLVFGDLVTIPVTQAEKNLRAAMKDVLRIQDLFTAEPLFAKTGRSHLKSEGVSTLQKIRSSLRRKSPARAK
jgi:hypothetical protein